jgi:hypothetical protein
MQVNNVKLRRIECLSDTSNITYSLLTAAIASRFCTNGPYPESRSTGVLTSATLRVFSSRGNMYHPVEVVVGQDAASNASLASLMSIKSLPAIKLTKHLDRGAIVLTFRTNQGAANWAMFQSA